MAQSYRDPNVNCSVGDYANVPNGWERWCDCMFDKSDPNWRKCIRKVCLAPWGCDNKWAEGRFLPGHTDARDPVDPGLTMPPWTEVGAGFRNIPTRADSVIKDVATAAAFDLSDYDPITLWATFNRNKAMWLLLAAKGTLHPEVALYANNPLAIAALAVKETLDKRLNYMDTLIKPALDGSVGNLGLVLGVLGNVTRPFALAGIVLQKVAKDQVDTNAISNISAGNLRAIIYFFAQNGETLGNLVQTAVEGAAKDLSGAEEVFTKISRVCIAFAKAGSDGKFLFPRDMRDGFALVGTGTKVAAAIANAHNNNPTPVGYADAVCFALFGVRFSELQAAASKGASAVQSLLSGTGAMAQSPAEASQALANASQAFGTISDSIGFVMQKLGAAGGVLQQLKDEFVSVAGIFDPIKRDADNALADAFKSAGVPVGPSQRGPTGPTSIALVKPPPPRLVLPATAPTLADKAKGAVLPAAGAAAGMVVAGPPGALIGGGIGLVIKALRGG